MSSEKTRTKILKRVLFIIPVIIAVGITVFLVKSKKGPERLPPSEAARTVRVIRAPSVDVVPRAVGYGSVMPGKTWRVVARVSGKVVEINPLLKAGNPCAEGAVLIRIDPAKYESAIAQAEAGIQSAEAQLAELDFSEKNNRALLGIEEKSLALSQKELDRQKKLYEKGTVAGTVYDKQKVSYYAQLSKVQNLKNTLRLIPATRKSLTANIALNQARLRDARLDLEDTTITAPFDCRITEVDIETAQFVQKGQVLASADGTRTAEVTAWVAMDKMRNLMTAHRRDEPPMSPWTTDVGEFTKRLGLNARVRLRSGTFTVEWEARFARADATIDPKTRAMGIIVVVDEPYKKMKRGVRPPLVRNMFCEVELAGRPVPGAVIVPRSALHEDYVYVANKENRLERRKVKVDFFQTGFIALNSGVAPDERVVVSDPVPAIDGMLLDPREDTASRKRIVAEAAGRAAAE